MVSLLILVFIIIALIEIPGLIRKKYWRELIVFSFFLLLVFIMTLLQIMGIKLPNPVKGLEYLIKEVFHLSYE